MKNCCALAWWDCTKWDVLTAALCIVMGLTVGFSVEGFRADTVKIGERCDV